MQERRDYVTTSSNKTTSGALEIGHSGLKAQLYRNTSVIETATDYSYSGPLTVLIHRQQSNGSSHETTKVVLSKNDTIEVLGVKSTACSNRYEMEHSSKE